MVGDGDQRGDDAIEAGRQGGVFVEGLGDLLEDIEQFGVHAPWHVGGGRWRDIEPGALEGGAMQGLRGDEIGVLGRDVPRCVGSGGALLDDEAEVVDESRRIVTKHFRRDVDLHDAPPARPLPRSTWYASQRVAFTTAEV